MPNSHSLWTKQEDKSFENAIATHFQSHIEPTNQRWAAVAAAVPTRTMQELKQHFELLVEDVRAIDAGHVAIPSYMRDNDGGKEEDENYGSGVKSESGEGVRRGVGGGGMKAEVERKKGIPWTEEEHRLFLLGLDKFGKGDWRSISRNFVITRTPTQVASHAQKYFIRLNSMNRDRRRSSIHDITNVDSGGVSNQAPITGQPNNNMNPTGVVTPTVAKQRTSQSSVTPALAMYGTQMGHPITGAPPPHMAPAVGTPYMVPPSHHHPSHYPVPMAYPVAPPPVHR